MASFDPYIIDPTALMSGQIWSKLWLCEEIEQLPHSVPIPKDRPLNVWVLGGWYCMTNLLLQSRNRVNFHAVSFDIDPDATAGARIFNEAFEQRGMFRAHTADVNTLDYDAYGTRPDIVINTSVEHITGTEWFDRIPDDTIVAMQSNDMVHDDHVNNVKSELDLQSAFPLQEKHFIGTLPFVYPDWSFNRFMYIGIK